MWGEGGGAAGGGDGLNITDIYLYPSSNVFHKYHRLCILLLRLPCKMVNRRLLCNLPVLIMLNGALCMRQTTIRTLHMF